MTRSFSRLILAAGAAGLMAGATSLGALAGSQTVKYYVPAGDGVSQAYESHTTCNAGNVASVCISYGGGPIDVSSADTSTQPTPLRLFFYDSTGAVLNTDAVLVCGSGHLDSPDGTAKVEFRVGIIGRGTITVGSTTPPDMACGKPGPATFGTISISGPGVGGSSRAANAANVATARWTSPAAVPARVAGEVSHSRAGRAPIAL